MRKLKLFAGLLICILLLNACSSDDDNNQHTIDELLTANSPWTFNYYEMINIIDAGNSSFTQEDIENETNISNSDVTVTFNEDGSGSSFTPGEGTDSWDWEIINNNQLKIIFDGGETSIFENFNVTSSQLTIETESVSFDPVAIFEVSHYGKFYYD